MTAYRIGSRRHPIFDGAGAADSHVAGWHPDDLAISRAYGNRWLAEQRTCVLLVPSVIVPIEYNLLINATHAEFVQVVPSLPRNVNWDKRLKGFMKR